MTFFHTIKSNVSKRSLWIKLFFLCISIGIIVSGYWYFKIRSSQAATIAGPVAYWKFDEGQGTTAYDSMGNSAPGTLGAGASAPTWKSETDCNIGKCLYFDGTGDQVGIGTTVSSIKSVSFWVRPSGTAASIIQLNGSASISASGGTISGTGFTSPTIYVNGKVSSTLIANQWQHIMITTSSGITGSLIKLGLVSSTSYLGFLDDVKLYDYVRSADQVKQDFNTQGSVKGSSVQAGGGIQAKLASGLVGYWKLDENTGSSAADFSGNNFALTFGTSNSAPSWSPNGKYGAALSFDGTNDYAENTAIVSTLTLNTEGTVSLWYKKTVGQSGPLFYLGSSGTNFNLFRLSFSTATQMEILQKGAVNDNYRGTVTITDDGSWHNLLFTVNNSGNRIYVDGVQKTVTYTTGTASNTEWFDDLSGEDKLRIGSQQLQNNGPTSFIASFIDEVRIYNRALSTYEAQSLYNLSSGPDVWYKFDEGTGTSTILDSSGVGASANLNGTVSNKNWVPGKFGNGYSLSGDDYISTNDTMSIAGQSQFTIATWLYIRTLDSTARNIYLECIAASCNTRLNFGINTSNQLTLSARDDDGDASTTNCLTDSRTLPTNTWIHVAAVYDSVGRFNRIYQNGVPVVAASTGNCSNDFGTGLNTNNKPKIGSNFDGSDSFFDGVIDDFKMYHYARSPSQIVEDMNGAHPLIGTPIGSRTAYWKMDEMTGTTAYDKSINQDNLTLSSASWTTSGKFNGAWHGTGSVWLSRADDDDLDFDSSEDFTLSLWTKSVGTTNPAANQFLLTKQLATNNKGYRIYFNTSGQVVCDLDDDTSSYPEDSATTSTDYYDGTWHQIVCIRDITNLKLNLYVDGVLKGQDTALSATGDMTNSTTFYVGDDDGDAANSFNGDIDDVKIYHAALSTSQINQDYNQGQTMVLGARSTESNGTTASFAKARDYCVPGDTSTCSAPVGEWLFNDGVGSSAADTSGNGNNLTVANNVPWVPGKVGTALKFINNNHDVSSGTSPTLQITGDESVSFWAYPTAINTDDFMVTVRGDTETAADNETFYLSWDATSGNDIKYQHENGSGTNNSNTFDTNLSTNQWYFISFARDTTANTVKLYVNGSLIGTYSYTNDPTGATAASLRVGSATTASSANRFHGMIDQLRIYNYARTDAQMAWEYNKGAPIAWYKMNEGSGTTVGDWGPNANGGFNGKNGTLGTGNSAPTWTTSGKYSNALSFDGTNDYVSIGTSVINNMSTFTISAWVNTTDTTLGNNVYKERNTASATPLLGIKVNENVAGDVEFQYQDDAGTWCGVTLGNIGINNGNWHHIDAVQESKSSRKLYIDGLLKGTDTTTCSTITTNNAYIGSEFRTAFSSFYSGKIDDVRIYNYGLTSAQVKSAMNDGALNYQ